MNQSSPGAPLAFQPGTAARALLPEELRRACSPGALTFHSSDELPVEEGQAFGHERALDALALALDLRQPGFHAFAFGPRALGKHALVEQVARGWARGRPVPDDICYVNNLEDPTLPRVLRLPAGVAAQLRRHIDHMLDEIATAVPAAFEGEEYQARRQSMEEEVRARPVEQLDDIGRRAKERGYGLIKTPTGLLFAPLKDDDVLPIEKFRELPEAEQERMKTEMAALEEEARSVLRRVPQYERELRDKVRQLDREIIELAVQPLLDDVARYRQYDGVAAHLDAMKEDLLTRTRDVHFAPGKAGEGADKLFQVRPAGNGGLPWMRRYQINVFIDHADSEGAPVVYEDHPTLSNLIGRIEHVSHNGTLVSDFSLIRPGALHKANGGVLIVDAAKLLTEPMAWAALKRALRSGKVQIDEGLRLLGLTASRSLEPEPIDLDVKVVLVGDRRLRGLLYAYDPEFADLFKVAADFDDDLPRSEEREQQLIRVLVAAARKAGARPLQAGALGALVEEAARQAGHADRLSAEVCELTDVIREAEHIAAARGQAEIRADEVREAIHQRHRRLNRARERIQDEMRAGRLIVDVAGAQIGQVNGLSVLDVGGHRFGRPSRITAQVRAGLGQVVDIEREVDLGGPLHSKGVLILSSFLSGRYAQKEPLALSASLVFEQSYFGVDGDSASVAELYCLLSAISEVPLRQGVAVTGSVDQRGRVQPVGGVNEKVEGFFDACQARGLTGEQGVILPAKSTVTLMLRPDVVEAVREGRFALWAIETVDQGIPLLTGLDAGQADAGGRFPEGSFNARVAARLDQLARHREVPTARPPRGERRRPT